MQHDRENRGLLIAINDTMQLIAEGLNVSEPSPLPAASLQSSSQDQLSKMPAISSIPTRGGAAGGEGVIPPTD